MHVMDCVDYIDFNRPIHKSYLKTYLKATSGPEAVKTKPELPPQARKSIPTADPGLDADPH